MEIPERLKQYTMYRIELFSNSILTEPIDDKEFNNDKIKDICVE